MKILICICLSSLAFSTSAQTATDSFSFSPPLSFDSLMKKQLWATQYYIHSFQSSGTIPILDDKGKSLGFYADTCDFCTAALEGTAYVSDSTGNVFVINYAKSGSKLLIDCRLCSKYKNSKAHVEAWGKTLWKMSEGFGEGVKNYRLVPFRTIAVDPAFIPYGSVIYIPQAKGDTIVINDSTKMIHDGYFFAGDTGGAIHTNHIDIFTGVFTGNPFSDFLFSSPKRTFDAYVIMDTSITNPLTRLHKPKAVK